MSVDSIEDDVLSNDVLCLSWLIQRCTFLLDVEDNLVSLNASIRSYNNHEDIGGLRQP